jgi:hypothetical protein
MTIIPERLDAFAGITLQGGAHNTPDDGMCLLEAAAYIAGEPSPTTRLLQTSAVDLFERMILVAPAT